MIARVVSWCSRRHWIVIAGALVLAAAGELGRRGLSGDVIPDLSDPQIGIVADWMGHAAPEVAEKVTATLTKALQGIPGSKAVRGSTMAGMAYVDVVFGSVSGLDEAHRTIEERLTSVRDRLPRDVRVQIGPVAFTPGTKMPEQRIGSAGDRAALVDFLKKATR